LVEEQEERKCTAPCAHVGEDTLFGFGRLVGSWHWHVGQCVNWCVCGIEEERWWKCCKEYTLKCRHWSIPRPNHMQQTKGDPVLVSIAVWPAAAALLIRGQQPSTLSRISHNTTPSTEPLDTPSGASASCLSLSPHQPLHNVIRKVAPTPRRQHRPRLYPRPKGRRRPRPQMQCHSLLRHPRSRSLKNNSFRIRH
jgi:hypothetical protein